MKTRRLRSRGRPRRTAKYPDGFIALADPTRRRIIELLARGDQPVHEIAEAFAVSRPAISKHLRLLKDAGVVSDVMSGRERVYRFQPRGLDAAASWIEVYPRFWGERLGKLGTLLERLSHE